jgi:hypothetical protein
MVTQDGGHALSGSQLFRKTEGSNSKRNEEIIMAKSPVSQPGMSEGSLSAEELRKIDAYWHASLVELSAQELIATAKKMVAGGKGLLAMDESESAPQ